MKPEILTVLLLSVSAAAAALLLLFRRRLSARAQSILLGLCAEAECYFGTDAGKIKLSSVLSRLYAAMPAALQLFFSEKTVRAWVEEAVATLRRLLYDGENGKPTPAPEVPEGILPPYHTGKEEKAAEAAATGAEPTAEGKDNPSPADPTAAEDAPADPTAAKSNHPANAAEPAPESEVRA